MDTQIQARALGTAVPEMGQRPVTRVAEPRVQAAAEPAKAARPEPTREALDVATRKVQQFVETRASELQFSVDDTSGAAVVRVFDKSTKELIRQIPSQEMLDMASAIENLQGLLLKQKA
jgi:flagellar protein FlaG